MHSGSRPGGSSSVQLQCYSKQAAEVCLHEYHCEVRASFSMGADLHIKLTDLMTPAAEAAEKLQTCVVVLTKLLKLQLLNMRLVAQQEGRNHALGSEVVAVQRLLRLLPLELLGVVSSDDSSSCSSSGAATRSDVSAAASSRSSIANLNYIATAAAIAACDNWLHFVKCIREGRFKQPEGLGEPCRLKPAAPGAMQQQ